VYTKSGFILIIGWSESGKAILRMVISLFQPQEQSATVLAASLLQDRPIHVELTSSTAT